MQQILVFSLTCWMVLGIAVAADSPKATGSGDSSGLHHSLPSIKPIKEGSFVKGFGKETANGRTEMHEGLDIKARAGADVLATSAGEVKEVSGATGSARVVIQHGNDISTTYSNLQSATVKVGSKVERSRKIGSASERPLFYQVLVNDVPVDPLSYIIEQ